MSSSVESSMYQNWDPIYSLCSISPETIVSTSTSHLSAWTSFRTLSFASVRPSTCPTLPTLLATSSLLQNPFWSAQLRLLPLDESLWHRRFAHHHHAAVKKLISEGVVLGLKLDSTAPADPICEPCLAGKLNAAPFPSFTSRTTRPLALIHSDVHGPLPVRTHSGYRYWSTWIDDYGRFKVVIPMKAKSETFDVFKQFKAYAETRLVESSSQTKCTVPKICFATVRLQKL